MHILRICRLLTVFMNKKGETLINKTLYESIILVTFIQLYTKFSLTFSYLKFILKHVRISKQMCSLKNIQQNTHTHTIYNKYFTLEYVLLILSLYIYCTYY